MKDKKDFDWSMHYFRAFAIVTIMAMHYCSSFGYPNAVNGLFHSSTIFFLFISGYLCQFIDTKHRESPIIYYRKKLLNVICPFLTFSVIIGLIKGIAGFNAMFVKEVLFGRVQGQYWYIPFVSFLFAASPFVCRLSNSRLLLLTSISLLAFVIFPIRPGGFALEWPHFFYLYAYFSVFYLIGFVYCRFKCNIDVVLSKYKIAAGVCAILITTLFWLASPLGLAIVAYDLLVGIQKALFTMLAIIVLMRLKDKRIWVLDQLAKYSFTLYFIHYGVFAKSHKFHDYIVSNSPLPDCCDDVIAFTIYVTVMLAAAIVVKKILGKFSRSIIGA